MNLNEKTKHEGEFAIEIDWMNVFKLLLKKVWLIVLLSAIFGSGAYVYSKLFIEPKYSSSIELYVNNTPVNNNEGIITPSDLTVAQSLVKTYMTILKTDDTYIRLRDNLEIDVSLGELKSMISTSGIADTEIFKVTVTADDPVKAQIVAAGIAEVLPERIEEIIDGSSMRVVNNATINTNPVSPNVAKNTIFGAGIGFVIACALIFVMAMLDDVIHSEDYVVETYNLPVLAKIPDLLEGEPSLKYGKYSQRNNYYYKKKSDRNN